MKQISGFEIEKYPNYVYKLSKALYGLKQAPSAWHGCQLSKAFLYGCNMEKVYVEQSLLLKMKNIQIMSIRYLKHYMD